MHFTIASLLANFSEDKFVAPKVLEKKLGCNDPESQRELEIALDALERIGLLIKERGKYRRASDDGLIEGRLRCSSKGFCFAIQDTEGAEDIFVREHQLSTAWNGDRVLVRVTREGRRKKSPEGEVKLILERGNPSVIARVKQTEDGFRGIPLDDRLLFEIALEPNDLVPDLSTVVDQLVHVNIRRYPLGGYLPIGEIGQILGSDAQSAPVLDLICCKHNLVRQFSPAVRTAAATLNAQLADLDLSDRQDLRELVTITLVAPGQEPQVAFSLDPLEANRWQLGIHISDVGGLLPRDELLDRTARRLGTTLATPELSLPLLPQELEMLRLLPGSDRAAISLLIAIDNSGTVQSYTIYRSRICVDACVTSEQVAATLALGDSSGDWLRALIHLAHAVSQQRQQRGSIELTFADALSLTYADEGLAAAISLPRVTPWTSLVILANELIARHLRKLGVPALYRTQPLPELYAVQDFLKLCQNLNLPLSLDNPTQVTPRDCQRFMAQLATADLAPLLQELLLDKLKPATDASVPLPHFSLATGEGYGHFCSPLQRYTDIVNQRILHLLLTEGRDRRSPRAKERVNLGDSSCLEQVNWTVFTTDIQREVDTLLNELVPHLQERERQTYTAWKDLVGLQRVRQVQACIGEVRPGIITGVQSYGFFVELIDFNVEGLVHVSSLKDDWYDYRALAQTLTGRRNRLRYRLGDRVEVLIKNVDSYRQQVDLTVVSGGSQATEEDLNGSGDVGETAIPPEEEAPEDL
ncbi:MAG: ribonuclease R [Thermosynechococcus sp. Uc]|uniref:ribonuclease R family protein n=1 Tax=Thermosynechococcus sp. Uc TaxID=3034853 RepID=UPI0019E33C33|nr:ribonuclease R family protein [Thermosynechococcus sp. Uc]MDM7327392.1 ribonuclease R [Thermosynechococcus sp. Uc]HIK26119.1 VacB/RNase II family 3'-5' exoribonuclease [Thermosynechococcus sp. M46_R2017_013]